MTKYFCDRCGKPLNISDMRHRTLIVGTEEYEQYNFLSEYDLCDDCVAVYNDLMLKASLEVQKVMVGFVF